MTMAGLPPFLVPVVIPIVVSTNRRPPRILVRSVALDVGARPNFTSLGSFEKWTLGASGDLEVSGIEEGEDVPHIERRRRKLVV